MDGTKDEIRREIRERRRALAAGAMAAAERAILAHLGRFQPYADAQAVLAYVAVDGEVPTGGLIEQAHRDGKSLFLPRMRGDRLDFAAHDPGSSLLPGPHGIGEPEGLRFEPRQGLATVAFVPLVAWDRRGVRLGRGGGHYDRALAGMGGAAVLVGLGYDFQQRTALPCDAWDVRLDYVLTEREVVRCGGRGNPALIAKEGEGHHGERGDDSGQPGIGSGAGMGTGLVSPAAR